MRPRAVDDADLAAEREEEFRQEAFWRATHKYMGSRTPGRCRNCGEPSPQEYCDHDCHNDFERRAKIKEKQNAER